MTTRTEFKEVGIDVFSELLPRVKASDVNEFLNTFIAELQDRGFDIEDDEVDDYEDGELDEDSDDDDSLED